MEISFYSTQVYEKGNHPHSPDPRMIYDLIDVIHNLFMDALFPKRPTLFLYITVPVGNAKYVAVVK